MKFNFDFKSSLKNRINYRKIATILAMVIPVVMALLCFEIIKTTTPGQFLPQELTMRNDEFDQKFFYFVDETVADSIYDSTSIFSGDLLAQNSAWKNIILENSDPFFLLGMILPVASRNIWFLMVFYLKFGLLGLSMYWLMRRHININSSLALIISTGWALSPMFLGLCQVPSFINMAILLPVVLSATDGFLRNKSKKTFILGAVSVALLFLTGVPGMLIGLPFVISSGLFLSLGLFKKASKMFSSWGLSVLMGIMGSMASMVCWLPRFFMLELEISPVASFENGSIRYTLLEQIINIAPTQPFMSDNFMPVNIYFGLFSLILILLFFINNNVPSRLKVTLLVYIIFIHLSDSYTAFNSILSLGMPNVLMNNARMLSLICILLFAAGISLKNMKGMPKERLYVAGFIIIAIMIIGNSSKMDSSLSFVPLYLAGICAIASTMFLISYSSKDVRKHRIIFMVLALITYFVSSMLSIGKTTITPVFLHYYKTHENEQNDFSYDEEDIFSVFNNDDSKIHYVIASSDLSSSSENLDFVKAINNFSRAALIGDVFIPVDLEQEYLYELIPGGDMAFTSSDGSGEVGFSYEAYEGQKIYAFSTFSCTQFIDSVYDGEAVADSFENPYIHKIDCGNGYNEIRFSLSGEGELTGRFNVYLLNQEMLTALNNNTYIIEGSKTTIDGTKIPGSEGEKTVLTSLPFSNGIDVKVNGKHVRTFEYLGKLAFVIDGGKESYDVSISETFMGFSTGLSISFATIMGAVAFILLSKYNKNKNNNQVREAANAKH